MVRENLAKEVEETGKPVDHVSRHLMAKAAYEMGYGLCDHSAPENQNRPFVAMAAHPKEDYLLYSSQYRDYERFISDEVGRYTNESMQQFFSRPRHEVEMIFAIVRRKKAKDVNGLSAVTDLLGGNPPGKH